MAQKDTYTEAFVEAVGIEASQTGPDGADVKLAAVTVTYDTDTGEIKSTDKRYV